MNGQTTNLRFARDARNLLITGHLVEKHPEGSLARKSVVASLEAVIDATRQNLQNLHSQLRIITALAEDTDVLAANIAAKYSLPLHVISPCRPPVLNSAFDKAERFAVIQETGEAPTDTWITAADEAKLALADALLIVWDGAPPNRRSGDPVRLLIESLRRFTPVIWVDARPETAGQVRMLDVSQIDEAALAKLNADENNIVHLQGLFRLVDADLQGFLTTHLAPIWTFDAIADLLELLQHKDTDPQQQRTFAGSVHSHFLSLFGEWKRKNWEAVAAYRGGDKNVQATSSLPENTWQWFDRLDRAATHASHKHRDQIVLIHLFASFAILCAIGGVINWLDWGAGIWSLLELGTLSAIYFIYRLDRARPFKGHATWLHFRQAAEALRMSALLHPMMASLAGLHRGVWQTDQKLQVAVLAKPYHWLIIQLLREAGVPGNGNHCVEGKQEELAAYLMSVIDDQISYHHANAHRSHTSYHRLHMLIQSVFYIVVGTVLLHLVAQGIGLLSHNDFQVPAQMVLLEEWVHHQHWLLLVTAFFPALAAGLHGIISKLELQRVARSSLNMSKRLHAFRQATQHTNGAMALRALALETAQAMYAEHDAWAELMQDQELQIPA